MEQFLNALRAEEQITLRLRKLYELMGYKKFRMRKFEEYRLYSENRSFLKSEQVITFNDLDGKLLALKPDVTLSIVKNTRAGGDHAEKLYYLENVYRLSRPNHEYREIGQMGLEYLGAVDVYVLFEVIYLAMQSLSAIDEEYILDISHMGFVAGLLDSVALSGEGRDQILECIRRKNLNDLKLLLKKLQVPAFYAGRIERLAGLSGTFEETLEAAQELAVNDGMQAALDELRALYQALRAQPGSEKLRLDFSIINDLSYYNGVILQGYVAHAPRAVLSGGRYDLLLKKFGRQAGAVGFALYLDELGQFYQQQRAYDVDALVLYGEEADPAALADAVIQLVQSGVSVRAVRALPEEGLRWRRTLYWKDGKLEEGPAHA